MSKYVLAMDYDEEGFDYDGGGEFIRTSTYYMEFDSEKDALAYLNENIYYNDSILTAHKYNVTSPKPNYDTVDKYCKEFQFRFYERRS